MLDLTATVGANDGSLSNTGSLNDGDAKNMVALTSDKQL